MINPKKRTAEAMRWDKLCFFYSYWLSLARAITCSQQVRKLLQREFLGYDPTLYIRSQRLEELTIDINNFLFIPSNEILRKDTSFFWYVQKKSFHFLHIQIFCSNFVANFKHYRYENKNFLCICDSFLNFRSGFMFQSESSEHRWFPSSRSCRKFRHAGR